MEAALRTDPKPPPQFRAHFGWVLYYNHDYERALQELEKAREGGVRYLETIAAVYVKLGRPTDAHRTVREMLTLTIRQTLNSFGCSIRTSSARRTWII